jgi:hypothetical protein
MKTSGHDFSMCTLNFRPPMDMNVGFQTDTSAAGTDKQMAEWKADPESKGHMIDMVGPDSRQRSQTHVGAGWVICPSDGYIYWTAMYGTPGASKMYGQCCPLPAFDYFNPNNTCE